MAEVRLTARFLKGYAHPRGQPRNAYVFAGDISMAVIRCPDLDKLPMFR